MQVKACSGMHAALAPTRAAPALNSHCTSCSPDAVRPTEHINGNAHEEATSEPQDSLHQVQRGMKVLQRRLGAGGGHQPVADRLLRQQLLGEGERR